MRFAIDQIGTRFGIISFYVFCAIFCYEIRVWHIYCTDCDAIFSEHAPGQVMLLCDLCERGYHIDCLLPPLSSVPATEWCCRDCASERMFDAAFVSLKRKSADSSPEYEALEDKNGVDTARGLPSLTQAIGHKYANYCMASNYVNNIVESDRRCHFI